MSINIVPPPAAPSVMEAAPAPLRQSAADAAGTVDFSRWMTDQLAQVNGQIGIAEQSLTRLATGDGNLHQVMLDLEKARTAFQLTLQVRNKLIEGYQEILRMQV